MAQPPSGLNPAALFEILNAYQRTAALKAAIELDVFTAIGKGSNTVAAIAAATGGSERGVRILCDYLVTIGLLNKSPEYSLTPDAAAFLDQRSPMYMGSIAQFLTSRTLMESFRDVAGAVRKGGTVLSEEGTMDPEHPVWVNFARNMAALAAPSAQAIAEILAASGQPVTRVLDVAAGHGLYGCAVAARFPNARVIAADWQAVLAVAKENAEKFGVADRWQALPGSAFDVDFGEGYDLVLVTNFYHHFDPATCTSLAARIHRALAPGGRMLTLEFVPNDDRITPVIAAQFSLTMLASTAHGDAYTFAEFDEMFRAAGFRSNELHPLPQLPEHVIVSHR